MKDYNCLGCLVVIIMIFLFLLFSWSIEFFQCKITAKELGYDCKYYPTIGCFVERADGKRTLLRQLRNFED